MSIRIEDLPHTDLREVVVPRGRPVPLPHPGQILLHEFLEPMGITRYRLAKELHVSQRRIGEIVAGTRGITVGTGLRLARFFGMSDGFWVGLQTDFDQAAARKAMRPTLAAIKPWPAAVQRRRA